MNANTSNVLALRDRAELDAAIDLLNDALSVAVPTDAPTAPIHLRERLLGRIADSAARHQGLVTVRGRHAPPQAPAEGVQVRWLYQADASRARRAGEPQRLAMIELQPGARLRTGLGLARHHSEWLVVAGSATIDGLALDALDHHGLAAAAHEPVIASPPGRSSCSAKLRLTGASQPGQLAASAATIARSTAGAITRTPPATFMKMS